MIFPKKKNKKSKQISMGTSLYDMNKSLIEKNVKDLTKEELQDKKNMIINFINNSNNAYYMLLCNERKDYTIFHRNYDATAETFCDNCTHCTVERIEKILIDECLPNRGNTKSIELTETEDAIEIWISIDGESYCYYFFPYDTAIIEC
jgi:hypothetical protein